MPPPDVVRVAAVVLVFGPHLDAAHGHPVARPGLAPDQGLVAAAQVLVGGGLGDERLDPQRGDGAFGGAARVEVEVLLGLEDPGEGAGHGPCSDEPLHICDGVPAGGHQADRRAVLGGERFAVHAGGQEGVRVAGHGEREAAFEGCAAAVDRAGVGSGEDDLDGRGVDPGTVGEEAEGHAREVCAAHRPLAPGQAGRGWSHQAAAVAGAFHDDVEFVVFQREQFFVADGEGGRDGAAEPEPPAAGGGRRDAEVVAYEEGPHGGDGLGERGRRGLGVVRVVRDRLGCPDRGAGPLRDPEFRRCGHGHTSRRPRTARDANFFQRTSRKPLTQDIQGGDWSIHRITGKSRTSLRRRSGARVTLSRLWPGPRQDLSATGAIGDGGWLMATTDCRGLSCPQTPVGGAVRPQASSRGRGTSAVSRTAATPWARQGIRWAGMPAMLIRPEVVP